MAVDATGADCLREANRPQSISTTTEGSFRLSAGWSLWLEILILAALYFVGGQGGLSLAFVNPSSTAVWPPTGIALAALLLRGTRLWPGVFLGAFWVNLFCQGTVATSIGFASGNTLEAVLGAWLVNRYAGGKKAFESPRTVFAFVGLAAIASTAVSATAGLTTLSLAHLAVPGREGIIWLTWWLGDMVGDLLVAPFLVIWAARPAQRGSRHTLLEAGSVASSAALVGAIVFLGLNPFADRNAPLQYLAVLPMLWAAFRFGLHGAISSALVISIIAVWGTLQGDGPFVRADLNSSLLYVQSFIGVVTASGLVFAAVVKERERAERRLRVHDAVGRALTVASTLSDAAPGIFRALEKAGGWEAGAIWMVNRAENKLHCAAFWHTNSIEVAEFETTTRETTFAPGIGLPGRVWSSGKPVWLADVTKDSNFPRASAAAKSGIRAAACFPLTLRDEILGVLECCSREVREPEETLLEVMSGLGGPIGHFIARKEAERAHSQAEANYRTIWENAVEGIFQSTPDGRYLSANPSLAATLGYDSPQELIAKIANIGQQLCANPQTRLEMAQLLAAHGQVRGFENEIYCKDGTKKWVSINARVVRDAQGAIQYYEGTSQDITDRKRAQDSLQRAQDELRRHTVELEQRVAERTARLQESLKSLDNFCYSIAHDLRAPLRAMSGFGSALLHELRATLGPSGCHYVERIMLAAAKMDHLINDLLQFGRVDNLELKSGTVELDGVMTRALATLGEEIRSRSADVRVRSPLLSVRASSVMLEQAVVNLLANALKFVPRAATPTVEVWTEMQGTMVRVCVRDNGIGVNPKGAAKLFQPFVRLVSEADFPGTGMGLAIVRKGIERMGGKVGFVSEPGKGSTFWVELPAATQLIPAAAEVKM